VKIGEEDSVDTMFLRQSAIGLTLGVGLVSDDLEHERVAALGELRFDARNEARKERVRAEELRIAGQDQANSERPRAQECPGPDARPPSELIRGGDDPFAGTLGHARLAAEGERHGTVRDPGEACDVLYRGAPPPPNETQGSHRICAPRCLPRLVSWAD
jgi:hypothetical protein